MPQAKYNTAGGALTGTIFDALAEQERLKRQALIDSIASERLKMDQAREGRLAASDAADTAYKGEALASLKQQREAAAKEAEQRAKIAEQTAAGTFSDKVPVGPVDENTADIMTTAGRGSQIDKTLPSTQQTIGTIMPAGPPAPNTAVAPQASLPGVVKQYAGGKENIGTPQQQAMNRILEDPRMKPIADLVQSGVLKSDEIGQFLMGSNKADQFATFGDYVKRKYGPNPTPEQIIEARKTFGQADDRLPQPIILQNIPGFGSGSIDRNTNKVSPLTDAAGHTIGQLNTDDAQWSNVVARVTDTLQPTRRGQKLSTFNRLLQEGNTKELADQVRQTAIEGENIDTKNQVMGRMTMRNAIQDVGQMLDDLAKQGVPSNVLTGTVEDVARKLGMSTNVQYQVLSTRIQDMLITYRRAATGVAFSAAEANDYARMFPNYRTNLPVNKALLEGLKHSIDSNDAVYWTHKLGPDGAKLVLGGGNSVNPNPGGTGNESPQEHAARLIREAQGGR